ncbi:pantoate--beta-alanine ligase [Kosmotoga arenicorallina S304]|uniref:Pantothenate synthetase n=1 Tax=Kosmotoga arenicorallina S304 TaxID=1453497 RepID=A0A176K2H6_9BACT|nr:pantoate--beta-alanine ligase [Kosmotoga arenicorallina]OAA31212.1 pantoate--beta-alanine ligase [Kosmotoga arenicorallina S304]
MEVIRTVQEMKDLAYGFLCKRVSHGFVPTMGYLHEGHLSLVRKAREDNDIVTVSIFVNPTQFGPNEDYSKYPRDEERDLSLLAGLGVDYVFIPEVVEMYKPDHSTFVEVKGLTEGLCGTRRPGHFRGVTTVVIKLFNIVMPTKAYFGQKDAQQFRVIRRMVRDLDLSVELVEMPIVRESDGLAMSSRNVYLSPRERLQAPLLHKALLKGNELIGKGITDVGTIKANMRQILGKGDLIKVDYVELVDEETLAPIDNLQEKKNKKVILAIAVYLGKARLIDNEIVRVP